MHYVFAENVVHNGPISHLHILVETRMSVSWAEVNAAVSGRYVRACGRVVWQSREF